MTDKNPKNNNKEGLIASYTHSNGRIGVLVELLTTTDFAARTELFKILAKDLCLQVAAMGEDKLEQQAFIKDPDKTVAGHIQTVRDELGEDITLGRIVRHAL